MALILKLPLLFLITTCDRSSLMRNIAKRRTDIIRQGLKETFCLLFIVTKRMHSQEIQIFGSYLQDAQIKPRSKLTTITFLVDYKGSLIQKVNDYG